MKPASDFLSSDISKFCAESIEEVDFYFMDGDEVLLRYASLPLVYAKVPRVFRICESKKPGEQIRRSQNDMLPLLATMIEFAVERKIVRPGSGVFIIEGRPPYLDGVSVSRVLPASTSRAVGIQEVDKQWLSTDELRVFLRCRFQLKQRKAAA